MKNKILSGISYHVLDSKNRVFIPQKYRSKDGEYVLTTGVDDCIYIYSKDRWQSNTSKIEHLSLKNKTYQRAFLRHYFSNAEMVKSDMQGRILIPQKMKEKYIKNLEVVIIGVKDKIELWDKKVWANYCKKTAKILKKIGSQLEL